MAFPLFFFGLPPSFPLRREAAALSLLLRRPSSAITFEIIFEFTLDMLAVWFYSVNNYLALSDAPSKLPKLK